MRKAFDWKHSRISILETCFISVCCLAYCYTLEMEATYPSETSVEFQRLRLFTSQKIELFISKHLPGFILIFIFQHNFLVSRNEGTLIRSPVSRCPLIFPGNGSVNTFPQYRNIHVIIGLLVEGFPLRSVSYQKLCMQGKGSRLLVLPRNSCLPYL
jgi:hypothetical protein